MRVRFHDAAHIRRRAYTARWRAQKPKPARSSVYYSEEVKLAACNLRLLGDSFAKIARTVGATPYSVRYWLKQRGIP